MDDSTDRGPRHAERVCAVGASYGGYSALMLALREPELIRCVVAIAAPTDLPLLFTSSDWSAREERRKVMVRWVGDPQDALLQQLSPLYRVADLTTPMMLIHGARDRRVDYEHSARLARAMAGHGKALRLVRIDDMEHWPETVGQHACIMGSAEQFIRAQLAPH